MLKKCLECDKEYSDRSEACIHCGAPNDELLQKKQQAVEKENESEAYTNLIIVIILAVIGYIYFDPIRNYFLDLFDVGIVSKYDLKDCSSDRVKKSIMQMFNDGTYAQTYHIKSISVDTAVIDTNKDAILSCQANLALNNQEHISYIINFKEQGDQIMIEGNPVQ
ncbi:MULTISPECIES: hypothetical protein [Acinetobacter]|uniref:Zinc ribbon domain-containing protein n=2 Tax=Acinetobacter TaxID=469 RepID=A0ABT7WME0_9GAMM|nr:MULTISPECIES: hypothetical protein [Acinetobacter]MCY6411740.1 hypothetical protein [Acinetobacter thutiue]MDH0030839.1 hypothetical protein [Acinetobacter sp. GD04021]MDH0886388.1 hypothetical protein [Acinetobacter sp. GD03873]MDH1082862.1 hypothetical protein [Acinetobacter sp. GD03983]MDH2189888.1 hypothetical protein [Acinetobacter sp. GD03645]